MPNFIQLTKSDGSKVVINVDAILSFKAKESGTRIELMPDKSVIVTLETFDDVKEAIGILLSKAVYEITPSGYEKGEMYS